MDARERIRKIMDAEGLKDWTFEIKPSTPYCWISQKKITLQLPDAFGVFLHELAHSLHPFSEMLPSGYKHYHDGHWADKFTELVEKYMMLK